MNPDAGEIEAALTSLVSDYRTRCLWFLDPHYTPTTLAEQLRVLGYIQRYGDVEAFRRASILRQWLLPTSSAVSVG